MIERPCVGRFLVVCFAWMNDRWHEELTSGLNEAPAKVAVIQREPSPQFNETYFKVPQNRDKYQHTLEFVKGHLYHCRDCTIAGYLPLLR